MPFDSLLRSLPALALGVAVAACSPGNVPSADAAVVDGRLPAHARTPPPDAPADRPDRAGGPRAAPEDVESVDAIMAAVYDVISGAAGEARDWDRFRSLFHPDARLIPARSLPASGALTVWTPDEYVEQVGPRLVESGFYESEIGRREERFGIVVHAFSAYESRATPEADPFSRGVNSFQLLEHGGRYWVLQILWDSESPDRPIPERYLERVPWDG